MGLNLLDMKGVALGDEVHSPIPVSSKRVDGQICRIVCGVGPGTRRDPRARPRKESDLVLLSAVTHTPKLYKVHIELDSSRSRVGRATPVLSQIISGPLDICDLRSLHE